MEQTAMQLLLDLIDEGNLVDLYQVGEHIKSIGLGMEKDQITDAYEDGRYYGSALGPIDKSKQTGEGYYNETYGKTD